ncbi:MAG: hypothetical protein ACWA5A_06845 [Marinibacterium sp.]
MLGVVLWSDTNDNKAVIWCEDQGDLAFCGDTTDSQGCILDTGDLIQFEVTVDRNMRLAQNPRRLSGGAYHDLADTLRSLPSEGPVPVQHDPINAVTASDTNEAEVIAFPGAARGAAASSRAHAGLRAT